MPKGRCGFENKECVPFMTDVNIRFRKQGTLFVCKPTTVLLHCFAIEIPFQNSDWIWQEWSKLVFHEIWVKITKKLLRTLKRAHRLEILTLHPSPVHIRFANRFTSSTSCGRRSQIARQSTRVVRAKRLCFVCDLSLLLLPPLPFFKLFWTPSFPHGTVRADVVVRCLNQS